VSDSTSQHQEQTLTLLENMVCTLGEMYAELCKMQSIPFPAHAGGEIGRDFATVAVQVRAALLDSLLKLMMLSYRFCEDSTSGTRRLQRSSNQFDDDLRRIDTLQDVTDVTRNWA
jgi:hypothetical protein